MRLVNLYEAKTHLSSIVDAVLNGEDIVIARSGKALVRLVAIAPVKPSDAFGCDRGLFVFPDDFDETPPEFETYR